MRSVSQSSPDDAAPVDLVDVAPPRPTFDDLVARVAAIDERVDAIDRFLFEDDDDDRRADE